LRKAVNIASAAPSGQIDWYWHRLVYAELLDTLQREKKTEQAKIVAEQLKEFEKTKPAGK
jgi:predicted nucleic acid-binding protein